MAPERKVKKRSNNDDNESPPSPSYSSSSERSKPSDESSDSSSGVDKEWRGRTSQVKIMFPNGEHHCISLTDTTALRTLFTLVSAKGFQPDSYAVYRFPNHIYTSEQSGATFRELGFSSREFIRIIAK
ncbi:hypothetical protein QR680_012575 [Steinernema hermaphroditum]|uniref:UBX domain-containing protein n=1 Tax=Steinernema hermaphroditum TaxID=289476 RepID=A0AA39M0Z0_9BILA|nr:hypothetical protein QR680_012575 [Steinernema hermaphroditum]